MTPQLATALLALAAICAILVVGWLVFREAVDPLKPLMDAQARGEREFSDYVRTELQKAFVGATNAEDWAVSLVKHWKKKNDQ